MNVYIFLKENFLYSGLIIRISPLSNISVLFHGFKITPLISGTVSAASNSLSISTRNVLIVVKDIEKSKKFYHDLFGLDTILDNDGNVVLTEGLVLQDEKIWKSFLEKEVIPENNACELYFEESDIEAFVEKLEKLYPDIKYVNQLMTYSWGQKVVRFYDLDGNLIEVRTLVQKNSENSKDENE